MGSSKQLGQAIKAIRVSKSLTQDGLSDKAGLAYSTLAKIEQGAIKNPSVFTIYRLAKALGVSVDELLESARSTNNNDRIKFVYSDMNGVLLRFYQHAFVSLANQLNLPVDRVEATFWHYNDPVNRGEITMDEFNNLMAKHLGVKSLDWEQHYMAAIEPVKEMHNVLRAAKAKKIKVGLLTNTSPGFVSKLIKRGMLPDIKFDVIIDSSEVGAVKPEPRIYQIAQKKAGVAPEEILLIDDDRANLLAAQNFGWRTLWFDDYNPTESAKRVMQVLNLDLDKQPLSTTHKYA